MNSWEAAQPPRRNSPFQSAIPFKVKFKVKFKVTKKIDSGMPWIPLVPGFKDLRVSIWTKRTNPDRNPSLLDGAKIGEPLF
jgi:hypothetical protein